MGVPPSTRLGLALATLVAVLTPPGFGAEGLLAQLREQPLSPKWHGARDLRWTEEDALWLAVPGVGVVKVKAGEGREEAVPVLTSVRQPVRLGASSSHVAAAGPLFDLAWTPLTDSHPRRPSFEFIEDIDVWGNRIVVLGTSRANDGAYAPDGAIAWVGSLDRDLADRKPVLYSRSGPGAGMMDACGAFEIGVVRFLPDGTFVVIPGAEPGVYLYRSDGTLLHTWETEPLGLEARCDFDEQHKLLMSRDPEPRWAWINQHLVVDDVLPLAQGPGLLVRRVTPRGTHWKLTVLRRHAPPLEWEVPISSPGELSHLRGDLRGNRLALLLFTRRRPSEKDTRPPRLFFAEMDAVGFTASARGLQEERR